MDMDMQDKEKCPSEICFYEGMCRLESGYYSLVQSCATYTDKVGRSAVAFTAFLKQNTHLYHSEMIKLNPEQYF